MRFPSAATALAAIPLVNGLALPQSSAAPAAAVPSAAPVAAQSAAPVAAQSAVPVAAQSQPPEVAIQSQTVAAQSQAAAPPASAPPEVAIQSQTSGPVAASAPVAAPSQNVGSSTGTLRVTFSGTASPSVNTAFCTGIKNTSDWQSLGVGDAFIPLASASFGNAPEGIFKAMATSIPGIGSQVPACGFDNTCHFDQYGSVCPGNPVAATVLNAMVNFSNFLQGVGKAITEAGSKVGGDAGTITTTFGPQAAPSASKQNDENTLGLLFTVLGVFGAFVPGLAELGQLGALSTIGGAALSFDDSIQADPTAAASATFDNFADISHSVTAASVNALNGLKNFTNAFLNSPPVGDATSYSTDPHQLPQIIALGGFAEPSPDVSPSLVNRFVAQFAGPSINKLWSQSQVIVAKASKSAFTTGDDPCTRTGGFADLPTVCDADGNALVLQSFPSADFAGHLGPSDLIDSKNYAVPGFGNLGDYFIDPLSIMTSAVNNQKANGLNAPSSDKGPSTESASFIDALSNADPGSVTLAQTLTFVLPVCDFSLNPPQSDAGISICGAQSNPSLCQFYQQMLIGCPQQQIGGQQFPFSAGFGSILIQ